ncbi:MAG: leucyl aminopeptidase, partial [Terriglobales bacterium]
MDYRLLFTAPAKAETDALVVLVSERDPRLAGGAAQLDHAAGGAISALLNSGEFSGRAYELLPLGKLNGAAAARVFLLGAGKAAAGAQDLRRLAGAAARQLKGKNLLRFAFCAPEDVDSAAAIEAIVTGVTGGDFDTGRYKRDREEKQIAAVSIVLPESRKSQEAALQEALACARAIAQGQDFARVLGNEPGNRMTPTELGRRAQDMARAAGLECELITAERARELKMGAFLSVAQGSAEPPVMIVLQYKGGGSGKEKLGLVGKGITFDSGGISIKPAADMDKMKFDMAGGAAVLGAMQAIAALRPKLDIIAIVPATENMPGGGAQKPGDVQIAMSGKGIEVLNTDAEGRLVLADGLHYAQQLGATHLVDVATLTGAVVIALAGVYTGTFSNNDDFYARFQRAHAAAGEKMWRLPVDDEYFEQIRGTVGDILNTGGRWGGAVTAAMFLREFAEQTPWVHLDVAGTAWLDDAKP